MMRKYFDKMPVDLQYRFHYSQFMNNRVSTSVKYLKDPEYLKVYKQYISTLEAFTKAIKEEISVFMKAHLPGPRREVNLYRLNTLRRFYERDSYNYFNYRRNIKSPMPPTTRRRIARGYTKDTSVAQLFGRDRRAYEIFRNAQEEVEALCRKVLERYKKSPDPKSDEVKKELIDAFALAQACALDSPVMAEIAEVLKM